MDGRLGCKVLDWQSSGGGVDYFQRDSYHRGGATNSYWLEQIKLYSTVPIAQLSK